MGTTVALGNVVGEAQQVFVEAVVPLQGDFDTHAIVTLDVEVEDLGVDRGLVGVQVFNECAQAAFVLEELFLAAALVLQQDADTRVQERQLADTLGENVPAEVNVLEGFSRRLEVNVGTGGFAFTDHRHRRLWHAMDVGLFPDLAATTNGEHQLLGQGVHHRDTYAVQTAGNLVGVVVELTAGVQHGHDDLGRGNAFFFMHVDRNTTAIVTDADGFVRVNDDGDVIAVPGQGFVDRVVDHLEYHVVQAAAVIGVANVHAGTLAYGIQPFQHLDAGGVVRLIFAHAFTPDGRGSG